jgi:hypothetical protein
MGGDMNNQVQRHFGINAVAVFALTVGWGISQAEEVSVAGIYSLVEVNGEQLPTKLWIVKPDGERCSQVTLEGALLLDSEGRSAAFLTERVVCPNEGESETDGIEHSVIFAGSYTNSGNQITIEDDFGTDRATLKDDVLVYETGEEEGAISKFVFRKE